MKNTILKIICFVKNKITKKNLFNIIYILFLLILIYYRIKIGSSILIDFDKSKISEFDSGFFLNNAMNFDKMHIDNPYALIKNRGFIWVLLIFHYLKVSPQVGISIFWSLAAIFMHVLSNKISKNRIISFISFTYVLYHPIAFLGLGFNELYRNTVYTQFAYLYISCLFILFYNINSNYKKKINILLSIFSGVFFVFMYFLSETGIVHLLIITFLITLNIIYIIYKNYKLSVDVKRIFISIILTVLPLIIFLISYFEYKKTNFEKYGIYQVNSRTVGECERFINNVQNIDSIDQDVYIWCSKDQVDKAYNVSDTFKNNQGLYTCLDFFMDAKGKRGNKGFHGDFLGWGVNHSIKFFGYTYKTLNDTLYNINKELEEAYRKGDLNKTKKISFSKTLGRYSYEDIMEIFEITKESIIQFITYNNLDRYIALFGNNIDTSGDFFKFFNMNTNPKYTDYKSFVLNFIPIYKYTNIILIIFTFIFIILGTIINIIGVYRYMRKEFDIVIIYNHNIYLLLSIIFLLFYLLYSFSISCFIVWEVQIWESCDLGLYYYSSISIVFLNFCIIFGFASAISYIKENSINFNKYVLIIIPFASLFVSIYKIYDLNSFYNVNSSINNDNKEYSITEKKVEKEKTENILPQKKEKVFEKFNKDNKYDKSKDIIFYNLMDNIYTNNKIYNEYNINKLIAMAKDKKTIIDNITLIGDSYCEGFTYYLEENYNFKSDSNTKYAYPGRDVENNFNLYKKGIVDGKEIIIMSIGVNDHQSQTKSEYFKEEIEKLYKLAYDNNKFLIIHSFVDYDYDLFPKTYEYKPKFYDYVIEESSKYFNNVMYIEANDIVSNDNLLYDGIHYGENFYKSVFDRIINRFDEYKK